MPTSQAGNAVVGLNGEVLPASSTTIYTGGRRGGVKAKTLRRMLKKAGLKTTGKKSTLTKRAKKARLMGGSLAGTIVSGAESAAAVGGRRRRRHRGGELGFGDAGGTYPIKAGDVGTGGRRRRRRGSKKSDSESSSDSE